MEIGTYLLTGTLRFGSVKGEVEEGNLKWTNLSRVRDQTRDGNLFKPSGRREVEEENTDKTISTPIV